jgi:hypothetical protein
MEKIRIRDKQINISDNFFESIETIFLIKNTKTLCQFNVADLDPGWKIQIRDPEWKNPDPGSRIIIQDPQRWVQEDADLGDGSVTLHESLALAVDEVAALAPATLRDEAARPVDSSRVELHKLHVLHHRPPTNNQLLFIYKVFLVRGKI